MFADAQRPAPRNRNRVARVERGETRVGGAPLAQPPGFRALNPGYAGRAGRADARARVHIRNPPSAAARRANHCGNPLIGVLIIAHDTLGDSLVRAVTHVLGARPPQLEALGVAAATIRRVLLPRAREAVARLDEGDGVLILSDIYGATPTNITCRLLGPGRVEGIAGVNLPMLVRALTYRDEPLATVAEKALSGGHDGIIHTTGS